MLQEAKEPSFKEAVFIVENTFYDNSISFEEADKRIQILVSLAKNWMKFNPLKNYRFEDSATVEKNYAIYKLLKDTIFIKTRSEDTTFAHLPYTYDFDDFFAKKDWSKMFVLKLLAKHNGNCHSFPFLYKNIRKL
ncbi:hypothetical protein J2T02_005505 [Chitinophaga terrae (ex Kim and Jung 2007)]|uniref:hypothetical protein n=1 Tax=Chitinophaga terrae (ex Kim and Jung 2007) TaxID=408074 RepID=UPI002789889C|nr:hypothetical protein [Chitinophaga terrae (ex Kim and Jung 2007)]MDQ0110355.1 hypothetical protein [Chitinophaga terrae (ex Kim and Jung 2007)]